MTTKPGPRVAILSYLAVNGLSVLADIMTGIHEPKRERVQSNLSAAVQDDLVARKRDDVSNQPAYEITTKGKNWLTHNTGTSSPPSPKKATAAAVQQAADAAAPTDVTEQLRESRANELALSQTITEICCALGSDPAKTTTTELVTLYKDMARAHDDAAKAMVEQMTKLRDAEATTADLRERLDQVTQQSLKDIDLLTEKNRKLHDELEHLRSTPPANTSGLVLKPTRYAVFSASGVSQHKSIKGAQKRAASLIRRGASKADVVATCVVARAYRGVQIDKV